MKKWVLLSYVSLLWSCGNIEEQESPKREEKTISDSTELIEMKENNIRMEENDLKSKNKHLIVFYNVENLFDTEDDPLTQDEAFTPFGEKEWTEERYQKKLHDLSAALEAISPSTLPSFIGLAEVENFKVVDALSKTGKLKTEGYQIIHGESPDTRGIDNALLYNPNYFSKIAHEFIRVDFPWDSDIKTRDILHAWGFNIAGEEIHIYVNHWPSRRDGESVTEKKRLRTADELKKSLNSVRQLNPEAKIIVMGDFNDLPSSRSIEEITDAKSIQEKGMMINLAIFEHRKGKGSLVHEGVWYMFDQLMISPNFLDQGQKGWYLHKKQDKAKSFYDEMLLYTDRNGNKIPNKTYGGDRYYGGYSDHLPVYFWLYESF